MAGKALLIRIFFSLTFTFVVGLETCEKAVLERLNILEERFDEQKASYDKEISTLRKALAEQTSGTSALISFIERLHTKAAINDLKKRQEALPSTHEKRQVNVAPDTVAFTAYMDRNVDHLGLEQVIPYNSVVTNIGGAFNVNTHTFLCPVSGLYFFTFIVSEIGDRELVAKLVIDGKNVIDAIANPIRGDHDQQGGNMAAVRVNRGQSVWVVNYFQNDVYLRSDENYRFSSFSGVLLQADAT